MNNREKLALLKLLNTMNELLYEHSHFQMDDALEEFRTVLMQEGNPDPVKVSEVARSRETGVTVTHGQFHQDPIGRTHEECDDCLKQSADPPKCKGHPEGPTHCMDFDSALIMCSCEKQHRLSEPCKQNNGSRLCGCGHYHRPSERCGPY